MANPEQMTDIELYRFNMGLVNAAMPTEARERLRQIRLWHWRQVLMLRAKAEGMGVRNIKALAIEYNRQADGHLKAVQALNDFFDDPGDSAVSEESRNGQELLRLPKEPVL